MKKRIISMLLTVLMVMSLFSGISVNAYAATTTNGANTIDYTMAQGDYVLRICQRLGLNYYTCKDAIMKLNGITDGQWNQLTVGRTLTLPASDYDALLISNANTVTYNANGLVSTASQSSVTGTASTGASATTLSTTNTNTAASADVLGYYLVPYTMSSGETVSGVCNSMGVNFAIFGPFVKQVNNISNWNKVRAGDTLIIPTPMAPSVGTTCYGVMEHIVTNSDTAYGIVSSNGVNYNANERLLKVLNQTENLAAIKAGTKFFYPVPLTVAVPGTGNPGSTSTTTTTTTVTDGNGTTTTQTTTTSKLYKLSSGMSASDGTMLFYVDNQAVTAAVAGAKVTVVTDTASGKAIQSLTVKNSDGSADFLMTGDTFIMPSCDVRVDAAVKSGHDINISANYSGKASASVGGISVQSAVKGATVIIKSADPNYEIQSVFASYKKLIAASNKTALTVSSSNAFIMPDADVDVEVVLKPVSTYSFYVTDSPNGNYYLQVNGSSVTRAAKGAQVTVVAKAENGYEPTGLTVTNHTTNAAINVFNNTFTMPAFDVDVAVTFGPKGNNILVMPSQFGNVYAFDKNTITKASEFVTEAATDATVYLAAINEEGATPAGIKSDAYDISYDVVRNSDGLKVKVTEGSTWTMDVDGTPTTSTYYTFKMPKGGVTVTPVITSTSTFKVYSKFFVNNEAITAAQGYKDCSFTLTWNNKTTEFTVTGQEVSAIKGIRAKIPAGEYIDLRYDSADGVAFVKYRITDRTTNPKVFEEETNEANLNGYFKMPNAPIEIEVYFETDKIAIGTAAITGVGTIGYQIQGVTGGPTASATCKPGDTVTIIPAAGNGYRFDSSEANWQSKLTVTRKDNGAPITVTRKTMVDGSIGFEFTMPAEGVNVQATFDPKPFVITMKCVDEVGNNFTGASLWQIAVNGVISAVDNIPAGTKVEVAYSDFIKVAMTESGWSNYDMVSFRIDGMEYTADVLNYFYEFSMLDEWAKDLEIVAVMRPRVTNTPTPHRLTAYYQPTLGNVQFILFNKNPFTGEASGTNYASNIDGVDYYAKVGNDGGKTTLTNARYTSYGLAGDYVGIIANSNDAKYSTSVDKISIVPIYGDADRIVPSELNVASINGDNNGGKGYTLYVFRMPDDDLSISVDFTGVKYNISVVVRGADGNPVNGMIDMYVSTSIFNDVAADSTFGMVNFNDMVTIQRSARAYADNIAITKVDVHTAAATEPVYYYDYSVSTTGPVFYMPASDVTVYITVDDFTPANVNLINFQYALDGGSLVVRSGPALTDPVLYTISGSSTASVNVTAFDVGDEVYVFEVPASGREHLEQGDLNITNNGIVYTVANWHAQAADGTNVWKVKIPAGLTVFTATWPEKEAEPAMTNLINTVNILNGKLLFDQTDSTMANPVLTYETGKTLFILAKPNTGYGNIDEADIIITDVNGEVLPVYKSSTWATDNPVYYVKSADMKTDGGITVSAEFPSSEHAITFALASGSAKNAKIAVGAQEFQIETTMTLNLEPGVVVTITSANSAYNKVKVTSSTYGKTFTEATVTYVVPNAADTVTITLTSGNPAVTLNSVTNGAVNFRKTDDSSAATDVAGNFAVGNDIYIETLPAYGYQLKKLEIKKNVDGSALTPTDSSAGYKKIANIPDGGITVSATFEPKTVTLNFTPSVTGAASGVVANVSTGNGINGTGTTSIGVTYGQTISVTPAAGYEWASAAMAVTVGGNPVSVSGSGNTGARSFEITNEGAYTISLSLVAVG